MKRVAVKEILLLCLPVLLVFLAIFATRVLFPGRDPNSQVVLNVTPDFTERVNGLPKKFSFAWDATAHGGPEWNYRIGYRQRIVASGRGRSQVMLDGSKVTPGFDLMVFSTRLDNGASKSLKQEITLPVEQLPVWAEKFAWQGDIVAAPASDRAAGNWGPVSPAELQALARTKGAARFTKSYPIPVSKSQLDPIRKCLIEPVNPHNAAAGADTCVTVRVINQSRKVFSRLIATDGKNARVLWWNGMEARTPYWITQQGTAQSPFAVWQTSELFQLKDVPASWGEISFLIDIVYDPKATGHAPSSNCDAATITKLKNGSWVHSSRRLILRKKGTTIVPRVFPRTPNTQLLDVQTSLSPQHWIIEARLRYSGQRAEPHFDSPNGPEFSNLKGFYDDLMIGSSYIVKPGKKPKEWIAEIKVPRANLKRVRPIIMKLEISDEDAAPLIISKKLQIPVAK
jgi:hypothetical protein